MSTVKPRDDFDPEDCAARLKNAISGLGTDEDEIIDVIGGSDNGQRQEIKDLYKSSYGDDLEDDLNREIKRNFKAAVLGALQRPREYDASELREAMKGPGTDESVLIEILCTRTNDEIEEIKEAYSEEGRRGRGRDLEDDLKSETRGNFERLFVSLVNCERDEDAGSNRSQAEEDAQALYDAGEGEWGTDESEFNRILCSRSYKQLRLTFDVYKDIAGNDIEVAISREFRGDLEEGYMTVVKRAKNKYEMFAQRIYQCVKGLGTDDDALIRIVVSRSELDLIKIKKAFREMYGTTLYEEVSEDLSGDYKNFMLRLITEAEDD